MKKTTKNKLPIPGLSLSLPHRQSAPSGRGFFLVIFLLILFLFSACDFGGESREAICRHKTVMAALVYSEFYPVRIAYGPNDSGGYHCQAQAFIDGRWEFLDTTPRQIFVLTSEQDDWFVVMQYYDLENFLYLNWFSRGMGYDTK